MEKLQNSFVARVRWICQFKLGSETHATSFPWELISFPLFFLLCAIYWLKFLIILDKCACLNIDETIFRIYWTRYRIPFRFQSASPQPARSSFGMSRILYSKPKYIPHIASNTHTSDILLISLENVRVPPAYAPFRLYYRPFFHIYFCIITCGICRHIHEKNLKTLNKAELYFGFSHTYLHKLSIIFHLIYYNSHSSSRGFWLNNNKKKT